jgi:hypothetical protein
MLKLKNSVRYKFQTGLGLKSKSVSFASAKRSVSCYELKQHRPWFVEEFSKI